jgi:hypothetical protein
VGEGGGSCGLALAADEAELRLIGFVLRIVPFAVTELRRFFNRIFKLAVILALLEMLLT